jgi:hypothetical protein
MLDSTSSDDGHSISAVAAGRSFVEKTSLYLTSSVVQLGAALVDAAGASFDKLQTSTTVRTYVLEDVVVDADTLIVFKDGRPIRDTVYMVPPDEAASTVVRPGVNTTLENFTRPVLAYNRMTHSYHHWITQCLSTIAWATRFGPTPDVHLLLPRLEGWQEATLRAAGFAAPRLSFVKGQQYRFSRLEYCEFLNGSANFGLCRTVQEVADKILQGGNLAPAPRNAIYVADSRFHYGSLSNHEKVAALMRRYGVTVVNPAELPLAERAKLFHAARLVIGPHSDGLTDVIFCRPGATFWELMPSHYLNACYNRLAQSGGVHYWGDALPSEAGRDWTIDLNFLETRLSAIANFVEHGSVAESRPSTRVQSSPLDELLGAFQNLGDNCEFGVVQREGNIEPLGLLRFAGFLGDPAPRLGMTISALQRGFADLGQPDKVRIEKGRGLNPEGDLVVKDLGYQLFYHSVLPEGETDPDRLRDREVKRLQLLRRKLLQDLGSGRFIWVWRSEFTVSPDQLSPLLDVLRSYGANTLLWVVEADSSHAEGTVERLSGGLLKGYVDRFAPYENAMDVSPISWFKLCQNAYELWQANRG